MAQNKKSFVVYTSWKVFLEDLSNEQLGCWFKWVLDYTNDLNPAYPNDKLTKIACKMTQDVLKRDLKKYEAKLERIKKVNDTKSLRNRDEIDNEIDNNIDNEIENNIVGVNVNVNDNVNVNVNDNVNDNNIYCLSACHPNDDYMCIFEHWNSKSIIVHKTLNAKMISAIDKAIGIYGVDNILNGIDRYAMMYNDNNYYFSYKWKLDEFLRQENALPTFLDGGQKWDNYYNSNACKQKQEDMFIDAVLHKDGGMFF